MSERRARPKVGAMVCMDMQVWTWPGLPHSDEVRWLDAKPIHGDWFGLRGENFGGRPYGNGAMRVRKHELDFKQEDRHE